MIAWFKIGHSWLFQKENNFKHTLKLFLEMMKQANVKLLDEPWTKGFAEKPNQW